MAAITYSVARPILKNEEGEWIAGEAVEAQTSSVKSRADALARKHGAVAFSRTGDPTTGEFEDATVIAKLSEVPDDLAKRYGASVQQHGDSETRARRLRTRANDFSICSVEPRKPEPNITRDQSGARIR